MGRGASGGASGGLGSGARGSSWPALTGSDKQIAWANDIRSKAQSALNTVKEFAPATAKPVIDKWESQMKSMTSAKQWIDARYDIPKVMSSNNPNVKAYVDQQNKAKLLSYVGQFNSWLGYK